MSMRLSRFRMSDLVIIFISLEKNGSEGLSLLALLSSQSAKWKSFRRSCTRVGLPFVNINFSLLATLNTTNALRPSSRSLQHLLQQRARQPLGDILDAPLGVIGRLPGTGNAGVDAERIGDVVEG